MYFCILFPKVTYRVHKPMVIKCPHAVEYMYLYRIRKGMFWQSQDCFFSLVCMYLESFHSFFQTPSRTHPSTPPPLSSPFSLFLPLFSPLSPSLPHLIFSFPRYKQSYLEPFKESLPPQVYFLLLTVFLGPFIFLPAVRNSGCFTCHWHWGRDAGNYSLSQIFYQKTIS